jgi:uncharacterized protein YeaO (DUF488 family)
MIRTKSVYSPIDRKRDGLRILATRFRGRYMPVNRYDVWMPNLAPGTIDKRNRVIKNHGQKFTLRLLQRLGRSQNLTLMCHCDEDQQQCHRHLLQKVLATKI